MRTRHCPIYLRVRSLYKNHDDALSFKLNTCLNEFININAKIYCYWSLLKLTKSIATQPELMRMTLRTCCKKMVNTTKICHQLKCNILKIWVSLSVTWHFHHASLPSFAVLTNPNHFHFRPLTPNPDLNIYGLRRIFCQVPHSQNVH